MMATINGVMTAILIVLFLGIWVWAWSARNKETFTRMSNLPLEDEIVNAAEVNRE